MERIEGGEGHGGTPAGAIVARPLRSIAGQNEPTFAQGLGDIERDVTAVLALRITRGEDDQHRPDLSRVRSAVKRSGKIAKSYLTRSRTRLSFESRYHADPAAAGCSSLRAHGRAGFFSLLIGSDFVVYRNGRALIFDSLILDFVITTEFIEIQKVK